ncbi:hypothetical protein JCGZ_06770 [Jatropha curcas]|uniref:Condensation domain-containing protein n=1 Tax=Jatropha curcas TaxID=180498 RepID=A0A067KM60_JATCU|nr:uncharacterized protein LOC105634704 [Jatropha curcas]KDP37316.1 hypothetical protein JCGZ_06770 [Jatropha curcas]
MSNNGQDSLTTEPRARLVGGTEYSWCKAVPGGTGIAVVALLLSETPNLHLLQNAFHHLQISHPILRSKLHFDTSTATFSFVTPPSSHIQIQFFDLSSTATIISNNSDNTLTVTPYHILLEHEINKNSWSTSNPETDLELLFASVYTLSESEWVLVLRLHTAACDRASAVYLLRELVKLASDCNNNNNQELNENNEIGSKIEDLIPNGKANKPFWLRGMDVVGYSLNSFRLANLSFVDCESPRISQVVRLQMNSDETQKLLQGCESRGIKLCAALAAAGLIATYSSENFPHEQRQKYAVVTLVDCRSLLDPVLSVHHLGFYHSAIMNTHDISGDDKLWEVAKRCYMSFANAKNNNKHFTDMGDLNFLMGKAIDNPGLTPSSALRTACISVFEDPVIDDHNELYKEFGVQDFIGCASVHGVGPSVAVFDTIRNGQLDSACVYPSPLHSREQMQNLIGDMKRILVDSCVNVEDE